MIERILRFALVGGIGYLVDAGMLLLLVRVVELPPVPGRIVSFLIAATVTFLLNKRFTFRVHGKFSLRKWMLYVGTTAFGAVINVGVYGFWIGAHGTSAAQLALGTALGSLTAMSVNFVVSQTLVFRNSVTATALPK